MSETSPVQFEAAVEAIINGDCARLASLLAGSPELVRARSARPHHATLLHYVAANGVEDERQRTPPNIVEISELLLRSGADVNATATCYGQPSTTLDLAATSVHPERTNVQRELMELLLDHGATLDSSLVVAAVRNGRLQAAEFLAGRCPLLSFAAAAAAGRLDLVEAGLGNGVPQDKRNEAFLLACATGQNAIAERLLGSGADVAAADAHGQTGLHLAAMGAHLRTVTLLLRHEPPLGKQNVFGGTALGQAQWSAAHSAHPERFTPVVATLEAAASARG